MATQLKDLARRSFRREWGHLTPVEQHVLEHVASQTPIARNPDREFQDARTFGERMADRMALLGGSWGFVLTFVAFLIGWVLLNLFLLARHQHAFDPYPFILLNLVLSMVAAIQAPIIMMSQNRQAAKDRLEATHDYEVNLKAELEIRSLQEQLDAIRDRQWSDLMALQREQLRLLEMLLPPGASSASALSPTEPGPLPQS